MTSMEAGLAVTEGIHRVDSDVDVQIRPLADGGEGTVDALVAGMNGMKQEIQVTGPLGTPVVCEYGIIESSKTAVIEMAGAAGITLVPDEKKNPLYTTTYGVGEVIKDAIGKGCRRFIIGIGGSATNDGGIGDATGTWIIPVQVLLDKLIISSMSIHPGILISVSMPAHQMSKLRFPSLL